MNNGITNKLKTLIGKDVSLSLGGDSGTISIHYPVKEAVYGKHNNYKLLRIDDEDCVVLGHDSFEMFIPIDNISYFVTNQC